MLKRLNRRDFLRLSAVASVSAFLAACGAPKATEEPKKTEETVVTKEPASQEPIPVVIMYTSGGFPEEDRVGFDEKYAPYKIEFIENDMTKFRAMLAAGQQLDVFRNWGINAPYMAARGIPLDLTNYFNAEDKVKLDDIMEVNEYYKVDGKWYGFVKDWSPDYSVFIRKDYFEEAGVPIPSPTEPVTMQQWREWAPKLMVKEGDQVTRWGTGWTPLVAPLFYQPTTYETPASIYNEDNTKMALIDNKDNYEAAKFMFDWKKEGTIPSAINPTIGDWSGPDFRDGVSASVLYGFWFSGFVHDKAEWDIPNNMMMLPAPKWGPNYANPCAAGTGCMVNSQTKIPDGAWLLFAWYMFEDPAIRRAKIGWGVPGLKSHLDLMPKEEPWRKQIFDMVIWEMENSSVFRVEPTPYVDRDAFPSVWSKYEESALKDEITFDEMLQNIETEMNELIQEGIEMAG